MDLTKVRLQVDRNYTFTGSPVYLLLTAHKKLLVTAGFLKRKRPDLYKELHTGSVYPGSFYSSPSLPKLPVGKGRKVGGIKVFHVDPAELSGLQRMELVGTREAKEDRENFVESGGPTEGYRKGDSVWALDGAVGELLQDCSPDGVLEVKFYTGAVSRVPVSWCTNEPQRTVITKKLERPTFNGLGVKEVAEEAELKPVEIRRFLRMKKIGKRGGRYYFTKDEAAKVVRAAKKHYTSQED